MSAVRKARGLSMSAQLAFALDAPRAPVAADEFVMSDAGLPYFYWSRPYPRFPDVDQSIAIDVHAYYGADIKAMKARSPRQWLVDAQADTRVEFRRVVEKVDSLERAEARARELLPILRAWFLEHEIDDPTCACCGDKLRESLRVVCRDCGRAEHGPAKCRKRERLEREAAAWEGKRAEYLASKVAT